MYEKRGLKMYICGGNKVKIALIGNQNSGKTTLFNILTGTNQKIGIWPGLTIEIKARYYKRFKL